MIRKVFFTALIVFTLARTVVGQYNYLFEHISTNSGLSHGNVSAMLKDQKGFMWFGTWDGLNRYDGSEFKVYKQEDGMASSASNRIMRLNEDAQGNIWVTTSNNKAFRFNVRSERFEQMDIPPIDSLPTVVNGIHPFSQGDVWISSHNAGLSRIVTDPATNRTSTQLFNTHSEFPIPGNRVRSVFRDSLRQTWIITNNGPAIYSNLKGTFGPKRLPTALINHLEKKHITAHTEGDNHIILGTEGGELILVDKVDFSFRNLDLDNPAPITTINVLTNGFIYAGTQGNGMLCFNILKNTLAHHFAQPEIQHILASYTDRKGMLWLESSVAGISSINLQTLAFVHYKQSLDVPLDIQPTPQFGLMEDRHYLWLTLKGGGFGYYNYQTDRLEYFFNQPGSANCKLSNSVKCFYKDPAGVLWLSTYFKGIEKVSLSQKQFEFVQPAPQSPFSIANEVRALLFDSHGYLWVATKNQEVFIYDKLLQQAKKITQLNHKEIGRVYALKEAADGAIYLGTKGNGLFVLKRTADLEFSATHFEHQASNANSLSNNNIYAIEQDKQGRIWIATYGGGLNLFDGQEFKHALNGQLNYPIGESAKLRCISRDDHGNLWIGTSKGICLLEPANGASKRHEFRFYHRSNGSIQGMLGDDVFWILNDRYGQTWATSLGGGLAKLLAYPKDNEPISFETISQVDGLPSNMVFAVTDDETGNLWMSTENGITSYNPNSKLIKTHNHYQASKNAVLSEGALATNKKGSIVFGANNGLYLFQPRFFKSSRRKVNLVLTDFKVFGNSLQPAPGGELEQSVTTATHIGLKHTQHVFSIRWAGLDYALQDRLLFRYKLKGYDDDWQPANELNEASYAKVPPGKYTFLLEFMNPELQQLDKPLALEIAIRPPYWKTIWAYILYAILFGVIFEMIIRLRNRVTVEKELSEVKLNFFTNISHELRTPLTLILGPVRELKLTEKLTDRGMNYLGLIEDNSLRLLEMVNQLLDFRKIQSRKMQLKCATVNLVDLANRVANHFEAQAQAKGLRFSVAHQQAPIFLYIDEEKIKTVLFNLLSNAFKFTPKNGSVEIRLKDTPGHDYISIEVVDSGIGIKKEQELKLFKPFMSEGYTTESEVKGTGIGLALAKEIVLLHGGKLRYKPVKTGGAAFSVFLPKNRKAEVQPEQMPTTTPEQTAKPKPVTEVKMPTAKQKPVILLVEDNPDVREFLQLQLSADYQVEQSKNGAEGLERAIEIQPDIILSDIMMPVMDGIELLDRLKNNEDTSHIPVVLLSAKTSIESKVEGLRYGADAYLTKPFESAQLKAQLENLLLQRKRLRELYAQQSVVSYRPDDIGLTDKDEEFLDRVQVVIEEHLANTDFKIEMLYSALGMGRSKFYNKLKGLTGVSPIDFVREFRLNKAEQLLQSGQHNVSEVSYMSGFSDPSYFSKCYKEKFGKSPSKALKK